MKRGEQVTERWYYRRSTGSLTMIVKIATASRQRHRGALEAELRVSRCRGAIVSLPSRKVCTSRYS